MTTSNEAEDLKANVEVSYMEIYNEKVFDLLDWENSTKKNGLKVRYKKEN